MKASLYIRVRMSDGKYLTTKPAFTAKGRIRPGYALVDGTPEQFDSAAYVLRYGKTWETIDTIGPDGKPDANLALAALDRKNSELSAKKFGLAVVAEESAQAPHPQPSAAGGRRRAIADAVKEYLDEIQLSKKPKTLSAYTTALTYFRESCKKPHLEDIDRKDMLAFKAFLRDKKKQSPRSCWNKFSNVMGFLKVYDIRKLVKPGDWPTYVEEEPEIYEPDELENFFTACTAQERIWFEHFLMSGMREQEVIYCCWPNLNAKQGTVSVSWKPEFGWTPKAYKEREIPIPAPLVDSLLSVKPSGNPKGLMFPTSGKNPKLDFLDCCKAIANRAGLDPDDWWLHKFRATFATMHLQAGVDLRTVQAWMGHVDLESTMRYLKPARGAAIQAKVNATFAGLAGAA
jgi:integrase/recombinase XerD